MAAVFTLKDRRYLVHSGHGQNGKKQEIHVLDADTTNTVATYELATRLHKVESASVVAVGTSTEPYIDEYANLDGDGKINAGGTSVTLTWAAAPKATQFYISLLGH